MKRSMFLVFMVAAMIVPQVSEAQSTEVTSTVISTEMTPEVSPEVEAVRAMRDACMTHEEIEEAMASAGKLAPEVSTTPMGVLATYPAPNYDCYIDNEYELDIGYIDVRTYSDWSTYSWAEAWCDGSAWGRNAGCVNLYDLDRDTYLHIKYRVCRQHASSTDSAQWGAMFKVHRADVFSQYASQSVASWGDEYNNTYPYGTTSGYACSEYIDYLNIPTLCSSTYPCTLYFRYVVTEWLDTYNLGAEHDIDYGFFRVDIRNTACP